MACVLLIIGMAPSETVYGVDEIVGLAIKENTTIQRDDVALYALRRKAGKSWSSMIPLLSAGGELTRTGESTAPLGASTLSASVSVSASTFAAMKQARLSYEAGLLNHGAVVREVERSVRKSFYYMLYEQEYVKYLTVAFETAENQYDLTLAKQRAGLVPNLDEVAARVNRENSRLALMVAENDYRNDLSAFKQSIGLSYQEDVVLQGSLDAPFLEGFVDANNLVAMSPEYLSLVKKLAVAKTAKKDAAMNVWSPTLSCTVASRRPLSGSDRDSSSSTLNVTAALSFQVNEFLPWSSARESALTADDSIKDLELQIKALITADSSKKKSLIREIENLRKTLETRRLTVSLADESYRLTEEAYKAGSKDAITMKNASDALQEAKVGMMKESYALISSVLDLEYLCGVPFGTIGRVK